MDLPIEAVNHWGESFTSVSLTMLLQSSVLIVILASVDYLLRNEARAIVRYSLWMLLLVKLILPVHFSLPTSIVRLGPVLGVEPKASSQRAPREERSGPLPPEAASSIANEFP